MTEDELLLSIELNVQLRRDPTTGTYSYYVLKAGAVKHGRGRNGGAHPPHLAPRLRTCTHVSSRLAAGRSASFDTKRELWRAVLDICGSGFARIRPFAALQILFIV
jgi:hypothetical protein